MKNQRQEYLLQIIAEEAVETQEQLLERLQLIFTRALAKKSGFRSGGSAAHRPPFHGTSRSCTSSRSR